MYDTSKLSQIPRYMTHHDFNNYLASIINSHVGVDSHNDARYVASANTFC
jgi:protoheme ferro-lyase